MRRVTIFIGIGLCALVAFGGCNRPSNTTSQKGAGGFPIQQYDSSSNVIPWEIPAELHYPNWTQMYPENNRIYLVADGVDVVAKWYLEKLAGSHQQEINGKRHVKVKNEDVEVDIELGDGQTKIVLSPLDLVLAK